MSVESRLALAAINLDGAFAQIRTLLDVDDANLTPRQRSALNAACNRIRFAQLLVERTIGETAAVEPTPGGDR